MTSEEVAIRNLRRALIHISRSEDWDLIGYLCDAMVALGGTIPNEIPTSNFWNGKPATLSVVK